VNEPRRSINIVAKGFDCPWDSGQGFGIVINPSADENAAIIHLNPAVIDMPGFPERIKKLIGGIRSL
jgi:hypothetical protein